jgi:hypothetical protein
VAFVGIGRDALIALQRLERQWLRGVGEEDGSTVLAARRRRFLSGPLAISRGETRTLSLPGGALSPRLHRRHEMRALALARLLNVDALDPDWWEETCRRNALRTLRGGIDWFSPGERGGIQGIVLDHEWPEVERLLASAPPRGKTAALRSFLIRKGVPTAEIKMAARKVIEAQRQRKLRRR